MQVEQPQQQQQQQQQPTTERQGSQYTTKMNAIRRLFSSHPAVTGAIANVIEAIRIKFPDAFTKDTRLMASVRMKCLTLVCRHISDNKDSDVVLTISSNCKASNMVVSVENLTAVMTPQQKAILETVVHDGATRTQEEMISSVDAFMGKRESDIEKKKKEHVERNERGGGEREQSSGDGRSSSAKKMKKKDATAVGATASIPQHDDAQGVYGAGALPVRLNDNPDHMASREWTTFDNVFQRFTNHEMLTLAEAKRIAHDYLSLSTMGKKMFDCFVSASGNDNA